MASHWLAEGSTWISTKGSAMQCTARCGHVLNVDAAYLLNSQSFILGFFSGLQGKVSFCGGDGTADRWGQLHEAS